MRNGGREENKKCREGEKKKEGKRGRKMGKEQVKGDVEEEIREKKGGGREEGIIGVSKREEKQRERK